LRLTTKKPERPSQEGEGTHRYGRAQGNEQVRKGEIEISNAGKEQKWILLE
jgi:hypothetical protein